MPTIPTAKPIRNGNISKWFSILLSLLPYKKRRMIWDFLKSKNFNIIFSILIGLGFAAILRPACKGDQCVVMKAPPVHEVSKSTYQMGSKCYQFKVQNTECSSKGLIESFKTSNSRS
jgi:hypothetical protein